MTERPGWLRVRGEESLASLNRTSLIARKLTSVYATVTTKMEFEPEVYQHSAGLTIYYDNMNNIFLRKYYSETLGGPAISIIRLENGEKTEMLDTRMAVEDRPIYLRLTIEGRRIWFEWSYDGEIWTKIGPDFDTTTFSDEYCQYGGTHTMGQGTLRTVRSLAHWAEIGVWFLNRRKRQAGRNPAQKGGGMHGAGHRRANQRRKPRQLAGAGEMDGPGAIRPQCRG